MAERGSVSIAMGCDRPYLYPLAVALSSLVRHADVPLTLKFGLAEDWQTRLSASDVDRVLELAESLGVSAQPVVTPLPVASLPGKQWISSTAFVKLSLLDSCAPGEMLVWFDADLMARRGWTSLVDDARGHAASGVHETNADFERAWPSASEDWYVNTGVIAVYGDAWQQAYAGQWRPYLDRYEEHGFLHVDQDVLNALIRDGWHQLPQTYNFRLGHSGTWDDPAIVHFAGWWKPWLRVRRQTRMLAGDWKQAFADYAEAEEYLDDRLADALPGPSRNFWRAKRRDVRGLAGWKATRYYVRGVMNG